MKTKQEKLLDECEALAAMWRHYVTKAQVEGRLIAVIHDEVLVEAPRKEHKT
jgi:hypothetical protein